MSTAGYILCTTPRSGSTMLCRMLSASGKLGNPASYFRREDQEEWAAAWGTSMDGLPGSAHPSTDFLEAVLSAGRGPTSVFGLRLMQESLQDLLGYLRALTTAQTRDRACLEAAFGPLKFVYLERDDVVSQAISLLRAEQSGLWHKALDGTELERLSPTVPEGYDFARLHQYVLELTTQKASWREWFDAQGIAPIHVAYEALCENPARVLTKLSEALGVIPPGSNDVRVRTAQLRDRMSADWKARYENDLAKTHEIARMAGAKP